MLTQLRRAVVVSIIFFLLLGLAYPALETGIGNLFFSHQANGSLTANGSTLVGQQWRGPRWFQGRADPDDPAATGSANWGPRSRKLVKIVAARAATLRREGITPTADLVTGSGSGVDPDISPADAYAQAAAVAKANDLSVGAVRRLIASQVVGPQFGFLGSSYINVLELNEALARLR
ncbi:MAG TPA: potassium-transporting ATPase subunit C [Acidimicrobiales bacterium]|nr:potassium-transporting ATPase subunit C [Acidimicrobiales bacterium]